MLNNKQNPFQQMDIERSLPFNAKKILSKGSIFCSKSRNFPFNPLKSWNFRIETKTLKLVNPIFVNPMIFSNPLTTNSLSSRSAKTKWTANQASQGKLNGQKEIETLTHLFSQREEGAWDWEDLEKNNRRCNEHQKNRITALCASPPPPPSPLLPTQLFIPQPLFVCDNPFPPYVGSVPLLPSPNSLPSPFCYCLIADIEQEKRGSMWTERGGGIRPIGRGLLRWENRWLLLLADWKLLDWRKFRSSLLNF